MHACAAGKFSVFGELLSQPSRLAPNAAVDCSVGQLVSAGLATSGTLLCASLLRSATKCGRSEKTSPAAACCLVPLHSCALHAAVRLAAALRHQVRMLCVGLRCCCMPDDALLFISHLPPTFQ